MANIPRYTFWNACVQAFESRPFDGTCSVINRVSTEYNLFHEVTQHYLAEFRDAFASDDYLPIGYWVDHPYAHSRRLRCLICLRDNDAVELRVLRREIRDYLRNTRPEEGI